MGPLGQAFGGWEPSVWPGQLAPSLAWSWFEEGWPTSASVRWPAALAAVLAGLILSRRVAEVLGDRAGVLAGLCWFGCLGLMDRSAGGGLDLMTGLFVVAAFDRLLGRGSDLVAGLFTALAFLTGGWPPAALILLGTVVLGQRGATLSWRLLVPPCLAAVGWSAWILKVAPAEAWGTAVALPLTQPLNVWLAPGVLALGLPWSPFVVLAASRSVREGWAPAGRSYATGWLQVTGVCLIAGTLVPGLATAARVPSLAGLAVVAAACLDRFLNAEAPVGFVRRWATGAVVAMVLAWAVLCVFGGGYLAAAVPYYRALSVLLIAGTGPLLVLAARSAWRSDVRGALLAALVLAAFLKITHYGYYVPEWNYRCSQGPWGRAVGQWVPPRWPVYTTHAWPADLAFATEHPFRQLASERHLEYQPGLVKFVLLLRSEFEHWPEQAPKLIQVAEFQDEYGQTRVLARTEGDLPWVVAAKARGYDSDVE
ncbi:MAG: hypothetical protein U0835_11615 [Isosphaeraceae bacterium]